MTNYRNFPMVPRIIYGRESISQLDTIISTKRTSNGKMVFLVDHFFENNAEFLKQIPIKANDILEYIDVTYEPKTSYVDELRDNFDFMMEAIKCNDVEFSRYCLFFIKCKIVPFSTSISLSLYE
jgi:hypothetical protein